MLKDKIEAVFGSSFNTNGLGAVLTCGVTGIRAGLSHSPVATDDGRERYVFFSFPHIAVDDAGNLGAIYRPNRPGTSCACGALSKVLGELKAEGLERNLKIPGVHDPLDPEFTILKQRLARRVKYEGQDPARMDLAGMTSVAERVITDVRFFCRVARVCAFSYCGAPRKQTSDDAAETTPRPPSPQRVTQQPLFFSFSSPPPHPRPTDQPNPSTIDQTTDPIKNRTSST